jgi:hypothetical protein
VTAVHVTRTDRQFDDLTIATKAGRRTITTTQHHLFWDGSLHTWREADNLAVGDELDTPGNGHVRVVANRQYTAARVTYNLTVDTIHTYYVEAGTTPVLVHNCGGYFPGHADSCTCEGVGDVTPEQGADEAGDATPEQADDEAGDFTNHAIERMQRRGVSESDAKAVLNRQPFSYEHEGQWKLGYYDPGSRVFIAKTIDGNINTVMVDVSRSYIDRLQRGR